MRRPEPIARDNFLDSDLDELMRLFPAPPSERVREPPRPAMTFAEIAQALGMSPQGTLHAYERAIRKLRAAYPELKELVE